MELSEFEIELEKFYNRHLQICSSDDLSLSVEDSLRNGAKHLLNIAKKTIE